MNKPTASRIGENPERDIIDLISHMRQLSDDVRNLTSDVAENSTLTQATLDKQGELQAHQVATDRKLDDLAISHTTTDKKVDDLAVKSQEMLSVFNAGKKGVSFFQALGRGLYGLARWAGPILAVSGAIYALFHGQPPKAPE